MVPTAAQLITIVILLVPGFLSIQVFSKLTPTRRLSNFDATVLSIIFSLIIHGTYTLLYSYWHNDCIRALIESFNKKQWSTQLTRFMGFYIIGLFIYSILIGILLAVVKEKGRFHKFVHWLGFQYSDHENLWDEMTNLYLLHNVTPVVIIQFEEESYAGWVYRASIDLEKNERREIILANPRYKKNSDEEAHVWREMKVEYIYLDLNAARSIQYVNGDLVTKSNL